MQVSGGPNGSPSTQNLGVTPTNQPSTNIGSSPEDYKSPEANPYSSSTNDYYSTDTYKSAPIKSYGNDEPRERITPEESARRAEPPRTYQEQRPLPNSGTQNYQPQTNPASFNPSPYQQSYMAPKQAYPSLKREPSSNNIAPNRSEVLPPNQQRPFQSNPPPIRPPTATQPVKTMPPPQKPSSYAAPPPTYPTMPPARPPLSSTPSFSSRPMTQRPITTTPASQFSNSPGYTPNRTPGLNLSQDPSRWAGSPIRPTLNNPQSDEKLCTPSNETEKLAMQAKFKNLIVQKPQPPETVSSVPLATRPPVTSDDLEELKDEEEEEEDLDEPFSDEENELDDEEVSLSSPQNEPYQGAVKSEIFQPTSESDTFVMKNIKFFEKNDKAKVPLTPRPNSSPTKKSPVRPNSIDIVNALDVKGNADSGVDASPIKHPNLRSIAEIPLKVAKLKPKGAKGKTGRSSYPGTPKRVPSAPVSFAATASMPQTPKRVPTTPRHVQNYASSHYQGASRESARKQTNGTSNGDSRKGSSSRGVSSSPAKSPATPKSPGPLKSPATPKSAPKTPDSLPPTMPLIKKIPMNKIQVGSAPSPNLKVVKSKIGSLSNASHKPGGGNIRIQSQKVDFSSAQARIANKNDHYQPSGGEKKIPQVKLQWNAKSKIGSLENTSHQPGGGEKKIESQKLDFKEKARSRVGSKDNVKYTPGGGEVKIETKKLEFNAQSKIGSFENVKHRPGGGNVQIFDDKSFIKGAKQQSNCDLAVVTEVRGVSESAEDEATDISIMKTTTIASSQPAVVKTTQVTVVSRSPSKERRDGSTHQVKLTYSTTTAASDGAPAPVPHRQVEVFQQPHYTEAPINKLLQNEQAAHEKVGEIWKETHNTPA